VQILVDHVRHRERQQRKRAAKLAKVIETLILRWWGEHFIDKITVPEIDAWVRSLAADYVPESIRHHVGLFRRIVGKARGQYLVERNHPGLATGLLFPPKPARGRSATINSTTSGGRRR
jgi:hypothetical protein